MLAKLYDLFQYAKEAPTKTSVPVPKSPKIETKSPAATKALSQADNVSTPSIPLLGPNSSPNDQHLIPFPPANITRSLTPTHSLDGSTHSAQSSSSSQHSRQRRLRGNASALGLDKMIDEKRDAKTMSERVVHIEVPFGKPIEEVYTGVHDGPVLGSGISGLVRLATHKATGLKYAVKCLDLGLVHTEEGLQQLREEIYIMCQLDHPNIVRLEEVYESHSEIYLVQELCLGGELFDRLDEQPDYHYTEAQCARLIKQMLCSVRYIHSKGIIHRDLKLENFLFSDSGAESELKMIDFGLSKHFKFGEVQHEAVGTPYTVAPEVIRGSYDERCDVWAIGVITYLLLSGESPFGGCGGPESLMQVRDNILKCNFMFEPEDIWENVSQSAKEYIKRLLVTDPNLRPTARDVQKDSWLVEMANRSKNDDDTALNPGVVKALVGFKEYSDMRKLLCEVLSFTLIPDQIQGLRKEFAKMDTDGSGEISLSALKTVLLGNAAQGALGALSEEEVEDIFNAMRVSKTETTIHWHEFIAAGLSHCKVDERNLKLAFDRLDSDHTGYITFENFMDLIGNGAGHSEEALRDMWGEASKNNTGAYITYEDFLLLMKGQPVSQPAMSPMIQPKKTVRPTTPMLDKLSLHPVMEGSICEQNQDLSGGFPLLPVAEVHTSEQSETMAGGFMSPSSFDMEEENADGPICIDDDDGDLDGALNQGFSEAMQHQGSGFAIQGSLAAPKTPIPASPVPDKRARSISFDSDEAKPPPVIRPSVFQKNTARAVNLPGNTPSDDKTPLSVNRDLYRAHRTMRLAVLEASKRLEEEQQRRAREEIRKEQANLNKCAGLIMRHGGELSADAIKQFVVQQEKEEQKKVMEASKRAGRRHNRNRTSSDIRGMFGSSGADLTNRTLPKQPTSGPIGGIPDFNPPSSIPKRPPSPSSQPPSIAPDLPELPVLRTGTKPGQFRKTNYDPFQFGMKKSSNEDQEGGELLIDSSLHRHLDLGLGFKRTKASGRANKLTGSGSNPDMKKKTRNTLL
mmetsp:Transcript_4855/g.9437  ORF Transcript_4855/g.9437 Transcript_4855/m.9437 type:complete len:1023 (-) Transcript_4855:448-3516(-)